jgi:hypothetical protein
VELVGMLVAVAVLVILLMVVVEMVVELLLAHQVMQPQIQVVVLVEQVLLAMVEVVL